MSDREQPGVPQQYRLTGEDTPIWLTIGFSLMGVLLCAAAIWLWANQRANLPLQAQSTPVTGIREQPREPTIESSAKSETEPTSATSEASEISVVVEVNNNTQSEPATPSTELSPKNILEEPIAQQDDSVAEQELASVKAVSSESSEQAVSEAIIEETPQDETLSSAELSEQQDDSATEISLAEPPSLIESIESDEQQTESTATPSASSPSPTERSEQQAESTIETPSAIIASPVETNESEADAEADATAESSPNDQNAFAALKNCPSAITISFNRGSVTPTITANVQEHLQLLKAWLNDQPNEKLLVAGHADSTGSERRNLLISHQRAKRVAELLSATGVSQEQIIILAFGEHNPIDGIPTDAEDNRRVSLQIRDSENCQVMSTKR